MSANPDVLGTAELIGSAVDVTPLPHVKSVRETASWNPEAFAREQIRTLVRRVFFKSEAQPARQVVFSGAGENLDLVSICHQVGEALALETSAPVAIVIREQSDRKKPCFSVNDRSSSLEDGTIRLATNLWRVAEFGPRGGAEKSGMGRYWASRLAELRNHFEFSVLHGPVAGTSGEAGFLAELADGIVLVLGAGSTRRASARKVKESLQAGSSRILGTVLSERVFPIPDRLYRRL